jgi:hypothetical protein
MNLVDPRFEPIREEFHPVKMETIRQLEAILNAPLPKEYVAFVARWGGCGFSGDANVAFGARKLPIFTFFDDRTLLANLVLYSDLTADSKLSIADDMAGNQYVLDVLTGKVYFLDFSVNPPVGIEVANSFNEFLASIDVQLG